MTKTPDEIKKGLVEAIEETAWVVEDGDAHDLQDACNMAHASMADALALIQQLEAQVPRWVPVEERLPEAKLAVLGFGIRSRRHGEQDPFPSEHIVYTRGKDEGWFTYWDGKHVKVTHWMPLPE